MTPALASCFFTHGMSSTVSKIGPTTGSIFTIHTRVDRKPVVVSGEQQKYGVALEPEPDKGGDVTDQQEPGNVSGGAPPVALRGAHLQRPADPEGEHDAFIRRVGCVSLLLL